jgi:carboxylesterase
MTDFSHPNAQPFRLGQGRDACLLIHGFTGTPSHMRTLGEMLAGHGFYAEGILLPGHGTRIEDMESANWRAWLDCAREAALRLRAEHERVFAIGLSMGGVLSLLLAEEGLCDAVVSLAAPMRLHAARDAALSRFIWPLMRYVPDEMLPKEDFQIEYDYGYDATPVRRVKDLQKLMRMAEKGLTKLTCPLLVVQSRADETVRPISADIIYAKAVSPYKEMLMLDDSPHVVTLGKGRERVLTRVRDFLLRQ